MAGSRLSPTERFRDELGHRLSLDAHLRFPSANVLVGVMIDALDALARHSTSLNLITLRNVLSVADEIISLGHILDVPRPETYESRDPASIPLPVLQDLQLLCLPRSCLDPSTCPSTVLKRSTILRTYLSIARVLSSYIGPQGVQDLVQDFHRPSPGSTLTTVDGFTRQVPGVGPRTVRVRRAVNPVAFYPVAKQEQKPWTPPRYQRDSRGWPMSIGVMYMERERHTIAGGFAKLTQSSRDEVKTGAWQSLRLKFKRFSS